jgi:two-component system, OmpR family, phosphate regulon sensor histidine kinase PhoR
MWPWNRPIAAEVPAGSKNPAGTAALAGVVAALPDAALAVDAGGLVIAANDAAHLLLDVELKGRHLSAAIRAPAVLEAFAKASAGGERSAVTFEQRVPTPRSIEAHVAPLAGPAAAVLIVLKDLTREQQIERMRADFVANASHELRTPLASLLGFVETMQGAARADEKARDRFLGLMKTQAERMKRLIDDLLSLSRIEMNEHVRPAAAVDLAQVARHVAEVMQAMAKNAGTGLDVAIGDPLVVLGDRDELVQVVQNLVENAIKYAGAGKPIAITGGRKDGMVELAVTDHGPGIAAEHLPRLTERFYRVSAQESRQKGGTGLGLAIVKHILNRHRGRLAIVSQPGRGSTFTIRLPEKKS